MKRIISVLLMVFGLTFCINVKASSFNVSLGNNVTIYDTKEISIPVTVSGANNLYGFRASLSYDGGKLKLNSYAGENGFTATVGTSIVVDNSAGKSNSFKVATLKFKPTANFKVGDKVKITLGTPEGSDGNTAFNGVGSSVTITMAAPKSSNNYLKTLTLSDGKINFKKDVTKYSVTVEHDVTNIKLNASVEDNEAKVSGLGTKELNLYSNNFEIVVTAANGAKKTYTIEVIRKDIDGNIKELSNDNNLASLSVDGYNFVFDKDILEYTLLLKNKEKKLNINAVASDEFATVTISDYKIEKGNNKITVEVLSENGNSKTYTINAVMLEDVPVVIEEESNSININLIINIIFACIAVIVTIVLLILIKTKKLIIKFNR